MQELSKRHDVIKLRPYKSNRAALLNYPEF